MDKGLGPPPPNPSRLANGQGFSPPPPTLHDLQMDKGLAPPPPNPSRLANGQGFSPPPPTPNPSRGFRPTQPFTTCKWTRVAGPQPFMTWLGGGPPPQPFTTCKWTRVVPPNPSRLANGQEFRPPPDLQMDKSLAPPTLHDLQMDKGLGPPPQPFTTCKWTRV